MKFPFFIVNAFCKNSFSGNPAGVCILEEWLSTNELQNIASQTCLPETAFVFPNTNNSWSIRWFTPTTEVDLCGHATLAAAYVLFEEGAIGLNDSFSFSSFTGKIETKILANNSISLNLPAMHLGKASASPLLIESLGAYPDEIYLEKDCLCIFGDEEIIHQLKPDFRLLAGLSRVRGVIVTSETSRIGYHFVSRFFCPRIGIDEDQATGSSHCMLGPFWGGKLNKTKMVGWQASQRGAEIRCELENKRVILSGNSEIFVRGKMNI